MKQLAICLVFVLLTANPADGQTPRPRFTGERVHVAQTPDRYQSVRDEILRLANTRQSYYAVIIRTSGRGSNRTAKYADRLFGQWKRTARALGKKFDLKRHVLIVVAVKNRQISLHVGTELTRSYGLRRSAINRILVRPHFVRHARAGDLAQGIVQLIRATEKHVKDRDARRRRRVAAIQRRVAKLRRTATEAIANGKKLLADAEIQIKTSQQAGFATKTLVDSLPKAKQQLTEAEAALQKSPQKAGKTATGVVNRLSAQIQQLRALPIIQNRVGRALAKLNTSISELDREIDKQRDSDLPVSDLDDQLDKIHQQVDQTIRLNSTDPQGAEVRVSGFEAKMNSIRGKLKELPRQLVDFNDQLPKTTAAVDALAKAIDDAVGSGVATSKAREVLDTSRGELSAIGDLRSTNLVAAKEALLNLTSNSTRERRDLARAIRTRRFLTITLPLIIVTVVVVILAAIFWAMRARYLGKRKSVVEAYEQLRQRVVEILDSIESFKEQHGKLSFQIDHYKEPMFGKTLARYKEFNGQIERFRKAWLTLMEKVEHVDETIKSARFPSTEKFQDAQLAMEEVSFTDVTQLHEETRDEFLELEQAPESAAEELSQLNAHLTTLENLIQQISDKGIDDDPFAPTQRQWHEDRNELAEAQFGDPLGVKDAASELIDSVSSLEERCRRVLALAQQLEQCAGEIAAVETSAANHRAQGLKLSDDRSQPDGLLRSARYEKSAAERALNEGNVELTTDHVDKATDRLAEAKTRIAEQLQARERCLKEFTETRQTNDQLQKKLERCQEHIQQLEKEFADDSWKAVSLAPEHTQHRLDRIKELDEQAEGYMDAEIQRYIQAAELLDDIQKLQRKCRQEMSDVERHLGHLLELRQQSDPQLQQLTAEIESLSQWLPQHDGIVGSEPTDLLTEAKKIRDGVVREMTTERPHWPRVWHDQADSLQMVKSARQLAESDVHFHEQFREQLQSTNKQASSVKDLLDNNTADRSRPNELYQQAQDTLGRIEVAANGGGPQDWESLHHQVTDVVAILEKARQLATEDIRLAQQAARELRAAESEISRAKSYFSEGVSADVTAASESFEEARRHYAGKNYELAVQEADRAEAEARRAFSAAEDAARRARRRREQAQWQARRRRHQGRRYGVASWSNSNNAHSNDVSFIGSVFSNSSSSSSSSSAHSTSSSSLSWSDSPSSSSQSW